MRSGHKPDDFRRELYMDVHPYQYLFVIHVIAWQNELLAAFKDEGKEEKYSQDYLRTIQAQLTAIFAHAVKYYNLPKNPSSLAGNIGKEVPKEMQFWTKDEYLKFAEVMMDKPRSYYAFELLYWTGIRSGELLALTLSDFDFKKQTLRINKTFHRSKGEDIITTPKTAKSNRIITLPPFLCDEMKDYLGMFYEIDESERLFSFTKSYIGHEMERGCKASGVKKSEFTIYAIVMYLFLSIWDLVHWLLEIVWGMKQRKSLIVMHAYSRLYKMRWRRSWKLRE